MNSTIKISIEDAQEGRLVISPPCKKFAVVGASPSTREMAPWDDSDYLIAGLNGLYSIMPRCDLMFELHASGEFSKDPIPNQNYLSWLRNAPIPIFMQTVYLDIPTSVRYPIESACTLVGRKYLRSTMAMMVAWGIMQEFEEIGIWGVDCAADSEYEHQRPNIEYIIGIAKGRGIKITIPKESALLKEGPLYGYDSEFGETGTSVSLDMFQRRLNALEKHHRTLLENIRVLEGGISETRFWKECNAAMQRGATIDPIRGIE